jgi:LmbE family N-acetylglucosaminyl deacetylase
MDRERRLLCVLARPGDESLAAGGALARYAGEGGATYLLTATRGEEGWPGDEREYPGAECLGQLREAELRAAAAVLGVRGLDFLDYRDGELARADPDEAIARIVAHLRWLRPQVVITFAQWGAAGRPDRATIGLLTTAAVDCAPDPGYRVPDAGPPHRVTRLYYLVGSGEAAAAMVGFGGFEGNGGDGHGAVREGGGTGPEGGRGRGAVTTRLDTAAYWQQVSQAVACHQTQLADARALARLRPEEHRRLWGAQELSRAGSAAGDGRAVEDDLFAGLR